MQMTAFIFCRTHTIKLLKQPTKMASAVITQRKTNLSNLLSLGNKLSRLFKPKLLLKSHRRTAKVDFKLAKKLAATHAR